MERRERAELEATVTAAMLRVFDKVQRSRRLGRDYGTGDTLTMVEAEICHAVAAAPGISPSELAELTGVTRSAVSQVLNRMKARGLVTVDAPPDNAKARVVNVTDTGAVVAKGVRHLYQEMSGTIYDGTDRDLRAFLHLFTRLDTFFADVMDGTTEPQEAARKRPLRGK